MSLLSTLRLVPGMVVSKDGQVYRIVDLANMTEVIAESEDGRWDKFSAAEFTMVNGVDAKKQLNILGVKKKQWSRALEIYEAIQPLVEMGDLRTRADVMVVAKKLDKHIATVYRWISEYEKTGLVSSLVRKLRGDIGRGRIGNEKEDIIVQCIDELYMTDQKRTVAKICDEVEKRCKTLGLSVPADATIRRRIESISEELRVRKREGYKAAKERFEPIRGPFPGADYPLAVVQIDHTPMDVIVVDDLNREAIGRPTLTIAIDVFSKMIVGFYITLESPSAFSTGLCLSNGIIGKEVYLKELELEDLSWPCWGVMRTIHADNAKEFRGTLLGKAAVDYGIIVERRPKGSPNYGGHVERAFRTYMSEVHNELPGTTFSNVQAKGDYDAEGNAVMTMDALEKWFTIFIVGVYHQKPHKGNEGLPPIVKWQEGIEGTDDKPGTGIPMRVPNEDKLRLDFLPYFERSVQEYGIRFEGIYYWADALKHYIHAKDPSIKKLKRKFICRYNPSSLKKLWMYIEEIDEYVEMPYRDITRPDISLWELKQVKKRLKEKSLSSVNEELIFKCIDTMREIVEEEVTKTKAARKQKQRQRQWKKSSILQSDNNSGLADSNSGPVAVTNDLDSEEEIVPFDGIRESE